MNMTQQQEWREAVEQAKCGYRVNLMADVVVAVDRECVQWAAKREDDLDAARQKIEDLRAELREVQQRCHGLADAIAAVKA